MKARFLLLIFTTILLSACTATAPAPSATAKAMDTVAPEASSTPTVAVTVTAKTSTDTPEPTETVEIDLTGEAQNDRATKIAKFSVNCKDFYASKNDLSPDENWLAVSCSYKRDQTLEIVSIDNKRWILQYKDYVPKGFEGGLGNLNAAQWSSDSHYLYFTSYIGFDGGGTCFYGYGIHGLFRIEVNTGVVSTVLPATDAFTGYYITFSPTGRRLAYEGNGNPTILDLQAGIETKIDVGNIQYQSTGDLTWSPDGLELAYATCEATQDNENNYFIKKSAVKIFSIQKQTSRTVIQMDKMMLFIKTWHSSNVMEILQSQYGFIDDGVMQSFDLNTRQWITPTPTPQ